MNAEIAFVALFGWMLIIMLLRVAPPFGAQITGEPIGRIGLSWSERVRLQRTNVYAIGAVLLIATVAGAIPFVVELLIIAAAVAILAIPVRYIVTSDGVALNHTLFRPWSDFTALEIGSGRLTLVPQAGMRPFHLILTNARHTAASTVITRFLPVREEFLSDPVARPARAT